MSAPADLAVVFDFGGVLIDWDPRYLYRSLFAGREADMEHFLTEICDQAWNEQQDRGRSFADGVAELTARHPDWAEMIAAYDQRWPEMLAGSIDGAVAVLRDVKASGCPLFGLTNWSAEKFPVARDRFAFLDWFDGIVVSGEVGLKKPEPAIFEHLCQCFDLTPAATVFIDDSRANVAAAVDLGFHTLHFESAVTLRAGLVDIGVLQG